MKRYFNFNIKSLGLWFLWAVVALFFIPLAFEFIAMCYALDAAVTTTVLIVLAGAVLLSQVDWWYVGNLIRTKLER